MAERKDQGQGGGKQTIDSRCGAINGLMVEVIEGHIRFHFVDPDHRPTSEQARATQELIDLLNSYMK
ncbi:MAG TPA: hypothetical protein DCK93_05630 [Blastocatellia bacterium]|jgi:DNA-binding FrmR family transcriptional regulator|nr:hypothetical protein [Blastocatellia bacterium]HAF22383.1 hypothetical protein [Blastocatellia bacterium]